MRLFTAISWFFKILAKGDAAFAEAPTAAAPPVEAPKAVVFTASAEPAVQLLGLLQKEGRLVDFLQEDISGFSDAEIGGAVRDIHRGCKKVLAERVVLRRVLKEGEGAAVTVPSGFDASTIALQGNVAGAGPYKGTVLHGGWYADEVKLPTVPPGADAKVVAPAQVEVK